MYEYKIDNIRVIDGDTVEADVHIGMNIVLSKRKIRFFGIDTWELRNPNGKGKAAKKHLINLLTTFEKITVLTEKDKSGKYGRLLGTLIGYDGYFPGQNINSIMNKHWKKEKK